MVAALFCSAPLTKSAIHPNGAARDFLFARSHVSTHYFAPQYCLCQHCRELKTPATEEVATSPPPCATLASLFLLLRLARQLKVAVAMTAQAAFCDITKKLHGN
jgi:hypothetical protein